MGQQHTVGDVDGGVVGVFQVEGEVLADVVV